MYAIAMLIVFLYIVWGVAARKEQVPDQTQTFMKPFYRMSLLLYKKLCIYHIKIVQTLQVRKDLERLYPGSNLTVLLTDYYVRKIALVLVVFLAGTGLGAGAKYQSEENRKLVANGTVARGTEMIGEQKLILKAGIEELGEQKIEIMMSHKEFTRQEATMLAEECWNHLCTYVLGKNKSAQHVTENLNCVQELEQYPFLIEWTSSKPEVISRTGTVSEVMDQNGIEVILMVELSYRTWNWRFELPVRVFAPERTEKEQIYYNLEEALKGRENITREQEVWQLPDQINGRKVTWKEQMDDNSILLFGIIVAVSISIFFFSDQDLHRKMEEKNIKIRVEYPMIVNKMTLYLGAGMTVRGAFNRIVQNYLNEVKEGMDIHPAYEEMIYTCRELQDGVAEGAAYEHFGKRIGLQEYIRLSTLLSQNLKKGNTALLPRLKEEAAQMLRGQLNYYKQLGEEAGTKMLIPMIMMLGIVMVLIMIPAFSSFGL